MSTEQRHVSTTAELLAAASDPGVRHIAVAAELSDVPTLRLSPHQTLAGADEHSAVHFSPGQHGLQLSANNQIENLRLIADPDKRVVFNDTTVEQLGRLVLHKLSVTGVIQLLARDRVRGGHVEVHDVDIVAADARGYEERPKGYGVEVIPGAFTLWNQQVDTAVTITADLTGLSAGRAGAPVRGSGIAPGTPDRITGGVFTVSGTFVDHVRNCGPVTTYGPNDMVLDNWGTVDNWVAEDKITSYGPSGIGFVNFGTVNQLQVNAPIETFGQGARGFNVYSGTVHSAEFERVVTHADGAVGIQVSQPVGQITVRRGIETFGGTGDSLVKGVVVKLSAIALSIKPGASVRDVKIAGGLITHGHGINPLELHGTIESLQVTGGLVATAGGFDKI